MRLQDLHYDLPAAQIAQHPTDQRDASRLLILDRATGACRHEVFAHLPRLLPSGAMMVLNDTQVLPARLKFRRRSGGRVEGLFLHEPTPGTWEIMLTESRRLRPGEHLLLGSPEQQLRLIERREAGLWHAQPVPAGDAHTLLSRHGRPPLPPYIKRTEEPAGESGPVRSSREANRLADAGEIRQAGGLSESPGRAAASPAAASVSSDADRYQTIYARRPGAVAAPTAGLHFTPEVFAALDSAGIDRAFVTLHVGAGTFAPIRHENLADHPMHAEYYECPERTAASINAAREQGRPVVAVGTTSVRVLESCAEEPGRVRPGSGWTRLFIYPPYRFTTINALLTNFHLPESTLLAMIFAFAGRESVLAAYQEAIRQGYRFYSYGDAMLIL